MILANKHNHLDIECDQTHRSERIWQVFGKWPRPSIAAHRFVALIFACSLLGVISSPVIGDTTSTDTSDSSDTELNQTETTKGAFIGAMKTEYPSWFKESFLELEQDVAEASEVDKRIIILFHQDGCPYCNALIERNLSQQDIEQRLRDDFEIIAINMWGDREVAAIDGDIYTEKSFAAALKIQFTPTLLFLDENGQTVLRLNGYYDPNRFRHALDFVTSQTANYASFADYLRANDVDKSDGTLRRYEYYVADPVDLGKRSDGPKKPYILFFEQTDCPNCDRLHTQILSIEENRQLLQQFDVFQIDLWGQKAVTTSDGRTVRERELADELGISYAPTLVLFDAEGTEVIRSEAYFKSFHTQSILDYVVSDAWTTEPSFQRYISARAEALREAGHDVDIWK